MKITMQEEQKPKNVCNKRNTVKYDSNEIDIHTLH